MCNNNIRRGLECETSSSLQPQIPHISSWSELYHATRLAQTTDSPRFSDALPRLRRARYSGRRSCSWKALRPPEGGYRLRRLRRPQRRRNASEVSAPLAAFLQISDYVVVRSSHAVSLDSPIYIPYHNSEIFPDKLPLSVASNKQCT